MSRSGPTGAAPAQPSRPDRRSVLVITYFFPPLGGVGVQRTLKFVTYLRRYGWQPVVVTPRNPAYALRDPSLLAAVPSDVRVDRSLSLEPAHVPAFAARFVGRLRARRRPNPGRMDRRAGGRHRALHADLDMPARQAPADVAPVRRLPDGAARRTSWIFTRALCVWTGLVDLVFFPDEQLAWVPFAVRAGWRLFRDVPVEILYSSSPPISAHLAAGILKGRIDRPWVADFRDPWVGNAFARRLPRFQAALQRRVERWIVVRADRIVLPLNALRDLYAERYPEVADRFVCIPNGYDRNDLLGLPPPPPAEPGRYRLVYGGSLYREHELDVFLDGVERLVGRRPEIRDRLRIEFVGRMTVANQAIAASFCDPGRLGGMLSFTGFLPRREALALMSSADGLLQLMAAQEGAGLFAGGKLLEYLAFDRPILAMMPPGAGRDILDGLGWGITADVDPAAVESALERLLETPAPISRADPTGRYDRIAQAGQLAGLFDELAARG